MKQPYGFFLFFLITLTCLISVRSLVFLSYIQSKKTEFRKELLAKEFQEVNYFLFSPEDLFKDRNGFEWKEKNKELVVNGVYYEVVGFSKKNNTYAVAVIRDKHENSLFDTYYAANKDLQSGEHDLIKQFMNVIYLPSDFDYHLENYSAPSLTWKQAVLFSHDTFIPVSIQPPEDTVLRS